MTESVTINLDERNQKLRFLTRLGALTGVWDFSWKKYNPRRSNRANAFYWAAVVQSFYEYRSNQGETCNQDQCHELLKQLHNPEQFVDPVTGEVHTIGKSTRMNVEEFSAYLERCIVWLAELGVIVPDPHDYGGVPVRS